MLFGAFSQSLPDIDFIAYFWLDKTDNLLAHRGITHSILFGIAAVAAFSYITRRVYHLRKFTWRHGMWLFGLNVFCHLFIDAFNAYGIGWLEPFSDARISFHILFVADPLFSIWPLLAVILILVFFRRMDIRKWSWRLGLGLSAVYLLYAVYNKRTVEAGIRAQLKARGTNYRSFFTTPSPFNSWLWFVAIEDSTGYYTGYRSVFDKKTIDLSYSPRNELLLRLVKDKDEVDDLLRFAQGYYTVEKSNDTIQFNIIRFGKISGWADMNAKFAFYYYFDHPAANEFLVQRGRFSNWNKETIGVFVRRMKGD